jgi:hypothetical protein
MSFMMIIFNAIGPVELQPSKSRLSRIYCLKMTFPVTTGRALLEAAPSI